MGHAGRCVFPLPGVSFLGFPRVFLGDCSMALSSMKRLDGLLLAVV